MKIEKLKKDLAGRYDLAELPDKINEIIDVLNRSFITDDPDTIYGKTVSSDEVLNGSVVLTDITCDTLIPRNNEHTLNEMVWTESENISDAFYIKTADERLAEVLDNMIAELEPNPLTDKRCPHCGESYYSPEGAYTTALYCPPIYKNGVNINKMKNTVTEHYHCYACGKDWTETT